MAVNKQIKFFIEKQLKTMIKTQITVWKANWTGNRYNTEKIKKMSKLYTQNSKVVKLVTSY